MDAQHREVEHVATVIDTKQLADGALAICVCCCGKTGDAGDEDTRSWLTIYNLHEVDAPELQHQVELHKANVQSKHEAALRARRIGAELVASDRAIFEGLKRPI